MDIKKCAYGLRKRYLDAILNGDNSNVALVVHEGIQKGVSALELYSELLIPSQFAVGHLWQAGKVSSAQEHVASQITLSQIALLKQWLKPKARLGAKAVISSMEGDQHLLGARMVSDFLFLDGWDVSFLGGNMPMLDLVEYVQQREADLVALSVILPDSIESAGKSIRAIKKLNPTPKILVSGLAFFGQQQLAGEIGADGFAQEGPETVLLAKQLMQLETGEPTLPDYLRQLGQRVHSLRKSRGWSQQQLAKASGLDRTYISAVEHGKQNITLAAISRLSEALQVPLTHLLIEDPSSFKQPIEQ